MKIDISTQKTELTPDLKKYINKKFARLEKFNKNFRLQLHLSTVKHKSIVHLILSGNKIYSQLEDRFENIYKAINKAYNKIGKKSTIRKSYGWLSISKLVRAIQKKTGYYLIKIAINQ